MDRLRREPAPDGGISCFNLSLPDDVVAAAVRCDTTAEEMCFMLHVGSGPTPTDVRAKLRLGTTLFPRERCPSRREPCELVSVVEVGFENGRSTTVLRPPVPARLDGEDLTTAPFQISKFSPFT